MCCSESANVQGHHQPDKTDSTDPHRSPIQDILPVPMPLSRPSCPHCRRTFSSLSNRNKHIVTQHSDLRCGGEEAHGGDHRRRVPVPRQTARTRPGEREPSAGEVGPPTKIGDHAAALTRPPSPPQAATATSTFPSKREADWAAASVAVPAAGGARKKRMSVSYSAHIEAAKSAPLARYAENGLAQCRHCPCTFTTLYNCNRHMRTVHGAEPYRDGRLGPRTEEETREAHRMAQRRFTQRKRRMLISLLDGDGATAVGSDGPAPKRQKRAPTPATRTAGRADTLSAGFREAPQRSSGADDDRKRCPVAEDRTGSGPNPLLSLPTEILHSIIRYLPGRDILNLLNTCSDLRVRASAAPAFARILRSAKLPDPLPNARVFKNRYDIFRKYAYMYCPRCVAANGAPRYIRTTKRKLCRSCSGPPATSTASA